MQLQEDTDDDPFNVTATTTQFLLQALLSCMTKTLSITESLSAKQAKPTATAVSRRLKSSLLAKIIKWKSSNNCFLTAHHGPY